MIENLRDSHGKCIGTIERNGSREKLKGEV